MRSKKINIISRNDEEYESSRKVHDSDAGGNLASSPGGRSAGEDHNAAGDDQAG